MMTNGSVWGGGGVLRQLLGMEGGVRFGREERGTDDRRGTVENNTPCL